MGGEAWGGWAREAGKGGEKGGGQQGMETDLGGGGGVGGGGQGV